MKKDTDKSSLDDYYRDPASEDMAWLKFFPAVHKSKSDEVREAVKNTENRRREIANKVLNKLRK